MTLQSRKGANPLHLGDQKRDQQFFLYLVLLKVIFLKKWALLKNLLGICLIYVFRGLLKQIQV